MKIFAAQDRGAVINVSSMTGISSSPWNGQYGAGKAFILKMTEAVACETEKTNVDVEVITLGTTLTPSLLSNLPGGPQGEAVMKTAQTPEEVVDEAFEKLGKELSVISGERNKASVHDWKANHTEDDYIRYMGGSARSRITISPYSTDRYSFFSLSTICSFPTISLILCAMASASSSCPV